MSNSYRRTPLNSYRVTLHSRLLFAVKDSGLLYAIFAGLSPASVATLSNLKSQFIFPALVLANFRLRYGDLYRLNLRVLLNSETLTIIQQKTKNPLFFEKNIFYDYLKDRYISPSTPFSLCKYDSLRDAIQRASRLAGVRLPGNAKDGTHIFRHLEASFQKQEGASLSEIRHMLGHTSQVAVAHYVHDYDQIYDNL